MSSHAFSSFSNSVGEHADAAERFLLHFAAWNPSWKLRPVKRFVLQRSLSSLSLSPSPPLSLSLSTLPPMLVFTEQIFYAFSQQLVFTEDIIAIIGFRSSRKLRLSYSRGETFNAFDRISSVYQSEIKSIVVPLSLGWHFRQRQEVFSALFSSNVLPNVWNPKEAADFS